MSERINDTERLEQQKKLINNDMEFTRACLVEVFKTVFSTKFGENWFEKFKDDSKRHYELQKEIAEKNGRKPYAEIGEHANSPEGFDFQACMLIIARLPEKYNEYNNAVTYYGKHIYDYYKLEKEERKRITEDAKALAGFRNKSYAHKSGETNKNLKVTPEQAIDKMESIVCNFQDIIDASSPNGLSYYQEMHEAHAEYQKAINKKVYYYKDVFKEYIESGSVTDEEIVSIVTDLNLHSVNHSGKRGFESSDFKKDKEQIDNAIANKIASKRGEKAQIAQFEDRTRNEVSPKIIESIATREKIIVDRKDKYDTNPPVEKTIRLPKNIVIRNRIKRCFKWTKQYKNNKGLSRIVLLFVLLALLISLAIIVPNKLHKKTENLLTNYPVSLDSFSLASTKAENGEGTEEEGVYTTKEINKGILNDSITLNSVIDSPVGNETNFVAVKRIKDSSNTWTSDGYFNVKDGDIITVCLYVCNDNPNGLNAVAENVKAGFLLPTTVSESQVLLGFIESSNTAKAGYYSDSIVFRSDENFYLAYIDGSAKYTNNKMGTVSISNDVIISNIPLGYDRFDGKIPGGNQYAGVITINLAVHKSVSAGISVKVRLDGTKEWTESVDANIGDTVEYQVEYTNLLSSTVNDVMIRDVLPNNIEMIDNSTVLYNSNHQDGVQIADNSVTVDGINIGNHNTQANSYVRFKGKVVDNDLSTGKNQLVNWAKVTVEGEVYKDDASVFVNK